MTATGRKSHCWLVCNQNLDRLTVAEIDRNEVDFVVNTHIHYDHVGWNTMLVEGR